MRTKNKKPVELTGKKFGIEIEFCSNSDVKPEIRRRLYNMIQAREISQNWEIKYDGSVNPGGNEIVSPVLTYNFEKSYKEIKRICDMIKDCNGFINGSCGFHVHVNYTGKSEKGLVSLAKEFYSKQALIFDMFKVLESRQNYYSKWIPAELVNRVKGQSGKVILDTSDAREWINKQITRVIGDRYQALNLSSLIRHRTAEFRLFNGTINPDKMISYVQFCLALVEKAGKAKRASKAVKKYNALTSRYDSRTWLLRLGFIGQEFKLARDLIRENLPNYGQGFKSDTAWRKARHGQGNGTESPELLPDENFRSRQF